MAHRRQPTPASHPSQCARIEPSDGPDQATNSPAEMFWDSPKETAPQQYREPKYRFHPDTFAYMRKLPRTPNRLPANPPTGNAIRQQFFAHNTTPAQPARVGKANNPLALPLIAVSMPKKRTEEQRLNGPLTTKRLAAPL